MSMSFLLATQLIQQDTLPSVHCPRSKWSSKACGLRQPSYAQDSSIELRLSKYFEKVNADLWYDSLNKRRVPGLGIQVLKPLQDEQDAGMP